MYQGLQRVRAATSGHYFYEGIRVTFGMLAPVVVGIALGKLNLMLLVALGALAAGITDIAGPFHHRKNGFIVLAFLIAFIAVLTPLVRSEPLFMGTLVLLIGFGGSMLAAYGNRSGQVGSAGLILFTLLSDTERYSPGLLLQTLLLLAGIAWYALLATALYFMRPHKLAQQLLHEHVELLAAHLKLASHTKPDETELRSLQNAITLGQDQLREVLFKSNSIMRKENKAGQTLIQLFLHCIELAELLYQYVPTPANTSRQSAALRKEIFHTQEQFYASLSLLAWNINRLKYGQRTSFVYTHANNELLMQEFEKLRLQNEIPPDELFTLRTEIDWVNDVNNIIAKIANTLTGTLTAALVEAVPFDRFVEHGNYTATQLLSHLQWSNNLFRHAVRVALAMLCGYLVSLLLPLGHSYWIILTIAVILKPAYAITRQRNTDRLLGTGIGVVIGALLIYIALPNAVLFSIMVVCMIISFSTWRNRYLISVLALTIYVMVALHLLQEGSLSLLLKDRIIDTAIGSFICLLFSIIIPPVWDVRQAGVMLHEFLKEVSGFISAVLLPGGEPPNFKLQRKNLLSSLAQLSESVSRMKSEPRLISNKADAWQRVARRASNISAALLQINRVKLNPADDVYQERHLFLQEMMYLLTNPLVNKDSDTIADSEALGSMHAKLALIEARRREEVNANIQQSPLRQQLIRSRKLLRAAIMVRAELLKVLNWNTQLA